MAEPVLSIQVLVAGGWEYAVPCLETVLGHTHHPFTLRVWDNASDPQTKHRLDALAARDPRIVLTRSGNNLLFGTPHNILARKGGEPVVCFLNSDILVPPDWDRNLVNALLADPLVGAAGTTRKRYHVNDYLEGSCLLMRREVAREMGPFDTNAFPGLYCEDSDLCHRLVETGYRLVHLPVQGMRHEGMATSRRISEQGEVDVHGIRTINQQRYRARWDYPVGKAYLSLCRWRGCGDVLCVTPALAQFHAEHPELEINFYTNAPEMLLGNPCITRLIFYHWKEPIPGITFDLDFTVEEHNHFNGEHMIDTYARALSVTVTDRRLRLYLSRCERTWAERVLGGIRPILVGPYASWTNRQWQRWPELVDLLVAEGWPVVLFGERRDWVCKTEGVLDLRMETTLRQAMALVAASRMLVCSDTGAAHFAGALGTPSVVLYGPVLSDWRVHDRQLALDTPLLCRDCHCRLTRGHPKNDHYCPREHKVFDWDQMAPCMDAFKPEFIFEKVKEHLNAT